MPQAFTPTRREFLRSAAAAVVFPAIVGATDKAATRPVVVGTGEHTYEWVDDWAKLPDGKRFGDTHAVVETADGRILVHNQSPTGDATCVFDPDGTFITSWGSRFAKGAHGMDHRIEDGQEFLYLTPTTQHKVFKTTLTGEVVLELDYPKQARDVRDGRVTPDYAGPQTFVPTFTAFGPNGDFYVTDGYGSSYVHRYTAAGTYVQSWGGLGVEPGRMNCPHGIWCDTRDGRGGLPREPTLVVADRANVRLQWFTLDGKLVRLLDHDLRHPCHFHQRGGDLLVPDLKGRVTLFDRDDNLICHLGDNPDAAQRGNHGVPRRDTRPGVFCTPHSARFDRAGNVFVVEWLPYGRVTKLRRMA